jgi:hypothetical protein
MPRRRRWADRFQSRWDWRSRRSFFTNSRLLFFVPRRRLGKSGDFTLMDTSPAINPCELTFEVSADLYRSIRRRHFSRLMRRPCINLLPIGIIGALGVFFHLHKGQSGGAYWLLICVSISPFAIWAVYYWATGQIRTAGAAPRYTLRVEPESITIICAKGSSTLKWSQVTTMWRCPDTIFLFWNKKTDLDHAVVIPTTSLREDLCRYIEDRIREHGGVVAS